MHINGQKGCVSSRGPILNHRAALLLAAIFRKPSGSVEEGITKAPGKGYLPTHNVFSTHLEHKLLSVLLATDASHTQKQPSLRKALTFVNKPILKYNKTLDLKPCKHLNFASRSPRSPMLARGGGPPCPPSYFFPSTKGRASQL